MLQSAECAKKSILVVDTHKSETNRLARELADRYAITCTDRPEEALSLLQQGRYDAAFIEMDSPEVDPIRLLRRMRREQPMVKVFMMTDYGDEEMWVDVLSEGACDLLSKPVLPRLIQKLV
jgi:DNA-binding NtrC family response regulator